MELSLGFIVSVAIAVFLAIDAPKHNRNPWIWGILGFFFSLITLGVYLLVTNRTAAGCIVLAVSLLGGLIILFLMIIGVLVFFAI
ncbi:MULTISPECIES: hypothetical protein [Bacillus]|uniref:Uncharacterized protein n=2 Tax=Bacillus TaxID=1386 RepID=A0A0M4FSP2_9BACI|nr:MULTISPECIES: hypothetical protein [Bacillus]ALC82848.1 hypothetical protein AM592_15565 [Bacillus gobiensis]MBP1081814.1 TM2 domain-containing membrane protein YozV [Bacillus capparidis]MED1096462.1 hypothetical protein [Bacillus capparidis]